MDVEHHAILATATLGLGGERSTALHHRNVGLERLAFFLGNERQRLADDFGRLPLEHVLRRGIPVHHVGLLVEDEYRERRVAKEHAQPLIGDLQLDFGRDARTLGDTARGRVPVVQQAPVREGHDVHLNPVVSMSAACGEVRHDPLARGPFYRQTRGAVRRIPEKRPEVGARITGGVFPAVHGVASRGRVQELNAHVEVDENAAVAEMLEQRRERMRIDATRSA